ncbi:MAG: ABC transporter ATP-binding protein [Candidatus Hodarchaeales archaeon]|jgi:ABC-type Fe3+/spermidine/putrescine transport system ATPase subunit
MVEVRLENVTKKFGDVLAVNDVSFEVRESEILTLLGPSGCGKSSTLRTVAGFYYPDSGSIYFGDKDVTSLPPQDRNTAMVFQNYALWPHMSVRNNVTYGLKLRDVSKEDQNKRAKEALKMVQMGKFIDRMPNKLSGGQQQRVAVARCLVVNPDVLLMDEPLSNLDAKLRIETRRDIRDLVKDLTLTAIYVTHDQEEALSISDYIIVMDEGKIRQRGKPRDIWERPANCFVGTFIGEANLLSFPVQSVTNGTGVLKITETDRILKTMYGVELEEGGEARIVLRPNRFKIELDEDKSANQIPANVRAMMYLGTYERITARLDNGSDLVIYNDEGVPLEIGQDIFLRVKPEDVFAFGPKAY